MANVYELKHPLIQHKLAILRNKETGVKEFRELVGEIAGLMCYEATRNLPTETVEVETPVAVAKCQMLAGKKLAIIPILRAGLGMVDNMVDMIPSAKIGHIGLTTHSLDTFRMALELDWVETIMFPYNIVENQAEDLMAQAKAKNIGFITMKPLAGGAIDNGTLALRYICANPNVTVVIPGMYNVEEVAENAAAASDLSPLTAEELAAADQIRKELGTNFCRRCNYCAPCTVGIGIPTLFLFQGYLKRYGLEEWARSRYEATPVKASACVECGVCETRCPYQLPIRSMLKKVAADFGA